jgi:hypothetical protein
MWIRGHSRIGVRSAARRASCCSRKVRLDHRVFELRGSGESATLWFESSGSVAKICGRVCQPNRSNQTVFRVNLYLHQIRSGQQRLKKIFLQFLSGNGTTITILLGGVNPCRQGKKMVSRRSGSPPTINYRSGLLQWLTKSRASRGSLFLVFYYFLLVLERSKNWMVLKVRSWEAFGAIQFFIYQRLIKNWNKHQFPPILSSPCFSLFLSSMFILTVPFDTWLRFYII